MLSCTPSGTERTSICKSAWADLCQVITSSETPSGCALGLQQLHESLDLLCRGFSGLRQNTGRTCYGLISSDYLPLIGHFLRQLCLGMISRWAEDIAMETAKSSQGTHNGEKFDQ